VGSSWEWRLGGTLAMLDPFQVEFEATTLKWCTVRETLERLFGFSNILLRTTSGEFVAEWRTDVDDLVLWPCDDSIAPQGWACRREEDHNGPCAAYPTNYRYDVHSGTTLSIRTAIETLIDVEACEVIEPEEHPGHVILRVHYNAGAIVSSLPLPDRVADVLRAHMPLGVSWEVDFVAVPIRDGLASYR
jgi:hypothetical protein